MQSKCNCVIGAFSHSLEHLPMQKLDFYKEVFFKNTQCIWYCILYSVN